MAARVLYAVLGFILLWNTFGYGHPTSKPKRTDKATQTETKTAVEAQPPHSSTPPRSALSTSKPKHPNTSPAPTSSAKAKHATARSTSKAVSLPTSESTAVTPLKHSNTKLITKGPIQSTPRSPQPPHNSQISTPKPTKRSDSSISNRLMAQHKKKEAKPKSKKSKPQAHKTPQLRKSPFKYWTAYLRKFRKSGDQLNAELPTGSANYINETMKKSLSKLMQGSVPTNCITDHNLPFMMCRPPSSHLPQQNNPETSEEPLVYVPLQYAETTTPKSSNGKEQKKPGASDRPLVYVPLQYIETSTPKSSNGKEQNKPGASEKPLVYVPLQYIETSTLKISNGKEQNKPGASKRTLVYVPLQYIETSTPKSPNGKEQKKPGASEKPSVYIPLQYAESTTSKIFNSEEQNKPGASKKPLDYDPLSYMEATTPKSSNDKEIGTSKSPVSTSSTQPSISNNPAFTEEIIHEPFIKYIELPVPLSGVRSVHYPLQHWPYDIYLNPHLIPVEPTEELPYYLDPLYFPLESINYTPEPSIVTTSVTPTLSPSKPTSPTKSRLEKKIDGLIKPLNSTLSLNVSNKPTPQTRTSYNSNINVDLMVKWSHKLPDTFYLPSLLKPYFTKLNYYVNKMPKHSLGSAGEKTQEKNPDSPSLRQSDFAKSSEAPKVVTSKPKQRLLPSPVKPLKSPLPSLSLTEHSLSRRKEEGLQPVLRQIIFSGGKSASGSFGSGPATTTGPKKCPFSQNSLGPSKCMHSIQPFLPSSNSVNLISFNTDVPQNTRPDSAQPILSPVMPNKKICSACFNQKLPNSSGLPAPNGIHYKPERLPSYISRPPTFNRGAASRQTVRPLHHAIKIITCKKNFSQPSQGLAHPLLISARLASPNSTEGEAPKERSLGDLKPASSLVHFPLVQQGPISSGNFMKLRDLDSSLE